MHLEEQYKELNKGQKSMTANQSAYATTVEVVGQKSLVISLNITRIQCAASRTSLNTSPTMWAGRLERENSGFSM